MKKFYLTMTLGLSMCAALAIANPFSSNLVGEEEGVTIGDVVTLGNTIQQATPATIALDGAKVTFVGENYAYVEDGTGAIQVYTEEENPFTRGTALSGSMDVTVMPGGITVYGSSEFTTTPVDVTFGSTIMVSQALTAEYTNHLVTFRASDEVTITRNEEDYSLLIEQDGDVINVVDFLDGELEFDVEGEILSVTGILLNLGDMNRFGDTPDTPVFMALSPRDQQDIEVKAPAKPMTIGEALALSYEMEEAAEVVLNVNEAKVTYADEYYAYVEDTTGALVVDNDVLELTKGTSITGTVRGTLAPMGMGFTADAENSEYTLGTADVTLGKRLSLEECFYQSNSNRLVTIEATSQTTIVRDTENYGLIITQGDLVLNVGDYFDAVDFPAVNQPIQQVTGILINNGNIGMMNGEEITTNMILSPRDNDDLILGEPIETITVGEAVAMAQEIEEATEANISVIDTKVTFTDGLRGFIEDETGAIMIEFENETDFARGTALNGYLAATIYPGETFFAEIDAENSVYSAIEADVEFGKEMMVSEALDMRNVYHLATFFADEETTIEKDEEYGLTITQDGDVLRVVNYLAEDVDFNVDGTIESVTGILMPIGNVNQMGDTPVETVKIALCPRDQKDIVTGELKTITIGEARELGMMEEGVIEVNNARVNFVQEQIAFIEDETGAIQLFVENGYDLKQGDAISGLIFGLSYGTTFVVNPDDLKVEVTGEADVQFGTALSSTANIADYVDALVTFNASNALTLTLSENEDLADSIEIGDSGNVICYDIFEVLPEDYKWEPKYKRVTGIVIEQDGNYFIAPRSEADIDAWTGVESIIADGEFNAYTINGVRVSSKDQLTKGMYIINGKKVLIKK